jgi:regulator of protease activity HflC (stomatin/prohibitin superfamily)
MAIGIIVGIILAVLAIVAFVMGGYALEEGNDLGGGFAIALGIVLLLAFIIVPFSFHTINTGEIAVVKHLGEITHTRGPGTNFDLWIINSYTKYDTRVQNVDIETMAYSSDAQPMTIMMTLQYQIVAEHVVDIAKQYGSLEALQSRIQSIAIEKTKSVLSSYKAMDIIATRAEISPAVEVAIKDAVGDEYFVNVVTVVLTNIDFSDAFEQAVEDKMIAEQAKLKAEYENQKKVAQAAAEAEAKLKAAQAEIDIAKAKADAKLKEAQAQIEIAKAEAEAKKIAAEAEAEANKIISDSITPEILEKIYADAWNGELPKVIGSGDYILPSDILG